MFIELREETMLLNIINETICKKGVVKGFPIKGRLIAFLNILTKCNFNAQIFLEANSYGKNEQFELWKQLFPHLIEEMSIGDENKDGQKIIKEIKEIELSSKKLTSLPIGIFNGCESLEDIHLQANQLRSLPNGLLNECKALVNINLGSNQLTSLPDGLFDGCESLEEVNLGFNQLTSLPVGLFNECKALVTIYLQSNQLASLPDGLFDGCEVLDRVFFLFFI